MPDELFHEISKLIHTPPIDSADPKLDRERVFYEYYKVVADYSIRKLSFDSDKLPAFSGIAAVLHPFIGGEYLAGIWSEDFRRGLLWYREMQSCRHTLSDQAPSWSWAVTNDKIGFWTTNRNAEAAHNAQLVDHSIDLQSQNIFGQVRSGRLVIEGFTKKLFRSHQCVNDVDKGLGRVEFDEAEYEYELEHPSLFEFSYGSETCFL